MTTPPNTPVLVGVAQRTWRDGAAPEPLDQMVDVARAAASDSGASGDVLGAIDSARVVHCMSWPYDDPPGRVAGRLGLVDGHRHYTGIGGTTPQVQVNDAAEAILRGVHDAVLIVGAEALDTKRQLKKVGERPVWSHRNPEKVPFPLEHPPHPGEIAHGLFSAFLTFALFDNARKAALGASRDTYRSAMGQLLAPMTTIAAKNPHAWFPIERSADEIVTPTPDNRLVGEPYTKLSVAIMDVDMAAALILTSEARADELGVPREQRIYPRGWAYGEEVWNLAERDDMSAAPGLGLVAEAALDAARLTIEDIGPLDLYSCFASSLHLACDQLGIDPTGRPLTVTGGLPYAGGPANNYMSHSIAALAEALRAEGGAGLVSGVGMHMTKHVFGVYATEPGPLAPVDSDRLQQRIDALPTRSITRGEGPATIVAWTMTYERDGSPKELLAVCELPDGHRTYAATTEAATLDAATAEEIVGTTVTLSPGADGKTLLST